MKKLASLIFQLVRNFSGAMWMLDSLSLLITGCMAWIACESCFFKLVVFHEPRHHAREAAQFFKNCDILFSCFHWQVTCYHFSQAFVWPLVALKYCANMKNWQKKKAKAKNSKSVVQKDTVSMTVYFLWLSIKSIIMWHQIVFWTVYWERSCQHECQGIMRASWQQGSRH